MGKLSDFISKLKKSTPPESEPADYIDITPVSDDKTKASPAAPKKGWFSRWKPVSKRDRQIAWLQAGYSETLDLMRSIRQHLDRQEDVQIKLANVLDRLPESMEGLKSVNKAAEQQVEVLGLLRRQIEANVHHDHKLVESMDKFNQTLGLMDETSRNSGRTVTDLIEKAKDSESRLREVIERSERRFMFVTTLFVVVILAAGALFYFYGAAPRMEAPVPAYSLSSSVSSDAAVEKLSISQASADKREPATEEQPKTLFRRMFHRQTKNAPAEETSMP